MTILKKTILALSNIGKGLGLNATTKLVDVQISTDASNALIFGSDNGLYSGASQLQIIGVTRITSSNSAYSTSGIAPSGAKAFKIRAVGGGASGQITGGSTLAYGGLPGDVDETIVMSIALLPSTLNITVGAGGTGLGTTTAYSSQNAGSKSTVSDSSGNLLVTASGGPCWSYAGVSVVTQQNGSTIGPQFGAFGLASWHCIPAIPGTPQTSTTFHSFDAFYGPGAGGCSYNSSIVANGSKGTSWGIVSGTLRKIQNAGGAGNTSSAGDGTADSSGYGFGGGGGAGGGSKGGNGGFPGAGGGGSVSSTGTIKGGNGGNGCVDIVWYG